MRVLFIGGTGKISSACSQLAVDRDIDLYLLNRGQTDRPIPSNLHILHGDIRDPQSARAALGDLTFDAVVNWIAFTPDQVQADLDLLRGRTRQYVFISSASAYQRPLSGLPITESTLLANPFWAYSRNKIACEELLVRAYREEGFPFTIVRPSHTYDRTLLPFNGGYTVIDRMRKGKPVIVHGDGSSLWVLTHHRDFAKGFVPLLGNNHAIGESVHITSDELLTWNQITLICAEAAGVPNPELLHVPSDLINAFDPVWGAGLIGDKTHSVVFDNSKIKRLAPDFACTIPFAQGAREIMAWYDADPARQVVDARMDAVMDAIVAAMQAAWAHVPVAVR
jgi:nucleoside-diphosphate-sugar epimerase